MKKTIQAMKSLRLNGASISYNEINAIAKGTVYTNDRTMLVEHGRHFTFTINWARNVFNEITRSEGEMAVANGYDFENSYCPEIAERRVVYILTEYLGPY